MWAANHALPVDPGPETTPPQIAVMPPANAVDTPRDGYVISVTLIVQSCSRPVKGLVTAVLPREFFAAERQSGMHMPRRGLFGIAFGDRSVHVESITPADWRTNPLHQGEPWWNSSFDTPQLVAATGRVAAVRLDDWSQPTRSNAVDVTFTAPWLRPRGYGSCWLAVPQLTGGDIQNLAVNASGAIDASFGPRSGATPLAVTVNGSSTINLTGDNQQTQTVLSTSTHNQHSYTSFLTPPAGCRHAAIATARGRRRVSGRATQRRHADLDLPTGTTSAVAIAANVLGRRVRWRLRVQPNRRTQRLRDFRNHAWLRRMGRADGVRSTIRTRYLAAGHRSDAVSRHRIAGGRDPGAQEHSLRGGVKPFRASPGQDSAKRQALLRRAADPTRISCNIGCLQRNLLCHGPQVRHHEPGLPSCGRTSPMCPEQPRRFLRARQRAPSRCGQSRHAQPSMTGRDEGWR